MDLLVWILNKELRLFHDLWKEWIFKQGMPIKTMIIESPEISLNDFTTPQELQKIKVLVHLSCLEKLPCCFIAVLFCTI